LAVSYLLLLSAIAHLNNPYVFLASIYEYRLVPRIGVEVLAMLLPFLHITIALCLIAGHRPSTMFTAASALFATYAGAQVIALLRGMEIDCGCFKGFSGAPAEHAIGWQTIGLALLGLLLSVVGWSSSRKFPACE
jgi:hypothetical protein